jgi:hypothetical protein
MSIQSTTNQIASIDRDIYNAEQQIANVDKSILSKQKEATAILEKIQKEKDIKRAISYQKDYSRKQEEISRIEKDKSTKHKALADKKKKRSDLMVILLKEEKTERDKANKQQQIERDKAKKEQKELLTIQQQITREMERQRTMSIQTVQNIHHSEDDKTYDVFVSHASEDKVSFVAPFVEALIAKGLKVWYDDLELKVGYSLRRNIDKGLSNSTFGIVVLSKFFFQKEWPQKELDGLFARESDGEKVILPIWHEISKNEVLRFSPIIADLVALNTSIFTIDEIAAKIADRVLSDKP